ncbi:MAG: TonB family protein [bacterium]
MGFLRLRLATIARPQELAIVLLRSSPISNTLSLIRAASEGDAQTVKALLAEGADVNGTNPGGQTALILAALMGEAEVVSLLLEAGADPGLQDRHGLTALEWSRRRGFFEATQLLENAASRGQSRPRAMPAKTQQKADGTVEPPAPAKSGLAGPRKEGFGPAAQAAFKSFQTRYRAQAEAASAEAPDSIASEVAPRVPEPTANRTSQADIQDVQEKRPTDAITTAHSESSSAANDAVLSIETEPQRLATDFVPQPDTTDPDPDEVTATGSNEVPNLTDASLAEDQTREAERASREALKRFEEEVDRNAKDEALASGVAAATTREDATRETIVRTAPVTREPAPPPTQTQPIATEQPAFQSSPLGLSLSAAASERVSSGTDHSSSGSAPSHAFARPLVWLLVILVLGFSAVASYRVTQYFTQRQDLTQKQTKTPTAASRVEPASDPKRLLPTIGGALAGMEVNVPGADYPLDAQRAGISGPIIVQIQVNKKGRVVSARSSSGDRRLRSAAVKAAKLATFSPEKLERLDQRGRVVAGTITYLFASAPTSASGAPSSSSATSSPTNPSATAIPSPTTTVGTADSNATPTANADPNSPVVGGPLVGTAIDVPAAEYPGGAKRSGASGAIEVTVRVNRAGKVISWRTSTGDSQLRAAALKAAKRATFSPSKLPGTGEVVGTITYTF